MLSMWPELLFLAPFAAFFIRIALSFLFLVVATSRVRSANRTLQAFATADLCIAAALFFGIQTQFVSLMALFCIGTWLSVPRFRPLPQSTNALAFVMALTLIITGPGPFAYDWPL